MWIESKLVPTSNARLLYRETFGRALNWQGLIGEVDQFIDLSARVERANSSVFLYFFDFPGNEGFLDLDVWVAREVIGFLELDPEGDFFTYDLDAGEVVSIPLDLGEGGDLTFNDLFLAVEKALPALKKEYDIVPTWRIRLMERKGQPSLFAEFFTEGDS